MNHKKGFLAGAMILLVGCSNSNRSQPILTVVGEEQAAEAGLEVNRVVSDEAGMADSGNENPETGNRIADYSLAASQTPKVTEEETQGIQILVSACIHASAGSRKGCLVDRKMLESDDLKSELEMQKEFIMAVYNHAYAEEASKRLANVVEKINEEEMYLTQEQLDDLLKMAGATPSAELNAYDDLGQWYQNGYYIIPKFYNISESNVVIDFKKIDKMEDGRVLVNAILRIEDDFGAVKRFKILLLPNPESIFQYSVESVRTELIQPDEAGIIGEDLLLPPYVRPDHMSNNPFDYIFELEGALYQMPFPAEELERNGWYIEEQGDLEAGGRKKVHARKGSSVLTIGLWNYNTVSGELKECQVVWLKTGRDKAWNAVDFKLAEGIESGEKKADVEPVYHNLNEGYTSYGRSDALYFDAYGYELHFEDDLIEGFEMGYAPTPMDRQKRIQMMTEGWEQDPITKMSPGVDFEMDLNHVYQVDLDGDGSEEAICLKRLGGVKWADYLCLFIDKEMNYVVRGVSSDIISSKSRKMVVENGQYFFIFDGEDAAAGNEIHRKIRVEKGWSKDVKYEEDRVNE